MDKNALQILVLVEQAVAFLEVDDATPLAETGILDQVADA